MAVKLAAVRRAEVTVTSPGKIADARRLGAGEAVLWSDADPACRARETSKETATQREARSSDRPSSHAMPDASSPT